MGEKEINIDSRKMDYEYAWQFAQMQKQLLRNLTSDKSPNVTYTRYNKEDLLKFLQTPKSNEKNIRNASIFMYDASSQYRRLILYYAQMLLWAYTVAPLNYSPDTKPDSIRKAYFKSIKQIESMNLKHELQKASIVALREGVLYGVQWSGTGSYFIQRINPDYCKLSAIEDGTWMYAVDFSKIKQEELELYPPEFSSLYKAYKDTGQKWQEVPSSISFCLKADETTNLYSIPPWASTLPMLYDIEIFKSLQQTASEIANYKVIGLEIPMMDDGAPKIDFNLAKKYYDHMASSLPPYVGAFMSPMKASAFNFEKGGGLSDVDTVSRSEEQFWKEGGTSPLLFGSADNDTAGALKLSVAADEEIMLGLAAQCERLVNRILKSMPGTQKFKINILPVTIFNQADWIKYYKDGASMGLPVKSAWAAALGLTPGDVLGMNYVEMNLLEMGSLTPMQSSYTQNGDSGRPKSDDGDLTPAGEQTRDDDTNASR